MPYCFQFRCVPPRHIAMVLITVAASKECKQRAIVRTSADQVVSRITTQWFEADP